MIMIVNDMKDMKGLIYTFILFIY